MRLLKLCIREPVIAIVISLLFIVLGVSSFMHLNMRYLPDMKIPVVTVSTSYVGAPASLMETNVTTLLEGQLSGIQGIEFMTSSSSTNYSSITIQFKLGGDFNEEVNQVRDKVSAARAQDGWPADASPPTITLGTNDPSMMYISFTDPSMSTNDIRDYLIHSISPKLRSVSGVAGANVKGGSTYAMRIWLNPDKMTALGITVSDVQAALSSQNIDISGGAIQGPTRSYGIVSNTRLATPQQFENIIVKQLPKGTIKLSDIATVRFQSSSIQVAPMRVSGKDAMMIQIVPLQGVNPITLSADLHAKVKSMQSELPKGMSMKILLDTSTFLKKSVDDTFSAIFEAVALVILVVFFFLGSVRASFIPIITIPVSLISVFTFVSLFGFSINIMSLLAIVLAIGLVVDDAIVMLENIHRHIEEGMSPMSAAIQGCSELASAVVAMSITLAAVFAPIGLVQGFTALLFQEFAFTLASAVLLSGVIALTLTPMMCSRVLKSGHSSGLTLWVDKIFSVVASLYQKSLTRVLRFRHLLLMVVAAVLALGFLFYHWIPSEFIPQEDQGYFSVSIRAPSGASLSYTDKYVKQIESIVNKVPQVASTITMGSASSPGILVNLKPWGPERKKTVPEIIAQLNPQLAAVPGVTASASAPDMVKYSLDGSDINLEVTTTGTYNSLLTPINNLMAILGKYPGIVNLSTNLHFDTQQYSISIKRDAAAELGVNINDIKETLATMMGGKHLTDVTSGSTSYQVLLQMRKKDLKDFDAIDKLYVRATAGGASQVGKMVPLASLVTLTPIIGQSSLSHYNRMRSAHITANLAAGYHESEVLAYVEKAAQSVMTPNMSYGFSGKSQQFLDSSGTMGGIMLMAFIFIYLVLAAQFRSFIDPLPILFAVPISLVGALLALFLTGGTLSLYSNIGMITLVGLISKHGILITQFINKLRNEGETLLDAIIKAATLRLRPILMTTAAMIFGTLPLALSFGPGSVGHRQIGWVIIGGLICGTFFTLYVVPTVYSYLGKYKQDSH